MPLHRIEVGNHIFEIICQEGEEDFLNSAAKLLDDEAQRVVEAQGRIGESRTLLMAGLILADRMATTSKQLKDLKAETEQRELQIDPTREAKLEAQANELGSKLAEREKEIEKLAADLAQSREALAKAEQRDAETSSEPARTPSQPDAKIAEELEHKTAQVKDLTARLVSMQVNTPETPEMDPYMAATIEAERDEAQSEAVAAKAELDQIKTEMFSLKEDMDARSKAESTARDELEAEISKQSKMIEELGASEGSDEELQSRLEAAEKTIERMVATAEAAAADLEKD